MSIVKCSNNVRSYDDLITEFIKYQLYEIDTIGKTTNTESTNRMRQIDEVNSLFDQGSVYMHITDKNNNIFKGKMETKFKKNTQNPFYLKDEVLAKARSNKDISSHTFYTCKVSWNEQYISEHEKAEYKTLFPKFLAKTLVVLKKINE